MVAGAEAHQPAGRLPLRPQRASFVFAGAQDNTIQRWDLATGKKTALTGHKSWVRALAFAAKEKLLFSGDWAGRILAWPIEADAPTPLRTIEAHKGWVRALAVSPDGKTLASVRQRPPRQALVGRGRQAGRRSFAGHTCHVYNVAFHPDGTSLVSGDLQGRRQGVGPGEGHADPRPGRQHAAQVRHHVLRRPRRRARRWPSAATASLLACAGITDVSNAFAGIGKPVVVLFDWQTGKRKQLLRPKTEFQGTCWGVVCHPAGFLAGAGGGNGGALWFWKPDAAQAFHTLTLPNNARDLDLHPDGTRLAVPFFDGAVRVYDMTSKGDGGPTLFQHPPWRAASPVPAG